MFSSGVFGYTSTLRLHNPRHGMCSILEQGVLLGEGGCRLEGEERPFKPAPPGTAASISRSYTSFPNLGAGHPSFARSHSSTVDWRTVARGSPSPIGRYMPGGGKLIGSSLVRSSKLESGRSTGSSTPGQPAPIPRLALA